LKSRLGLAHRPSEEDAPEATIAELERREWGVVVAARDGAEAVAAFVADLLYRREGDGFQTCREPRDPAA